MPDMRGMRCRLPGELGKPSAQVAGGRCRLGDHLHWLDVSVTPARTGRGGASALVSGEQGFGMIGTGRPRRAHPCSETPSGTKAPTVFASWGLEVERAVLQFV